VKVTPNFPEECRFVLDTLGEVYGYDEQARAQGLSAEERLRFHHEHSGPVMEKRLFAVWCGCESGVALGRVRRPCCGAQPTGT
jgi:hypothetical protein